MEIKQIEFEDKLYPEQLRKIDKPPQKLYVLGDEKALNSQCISIIGSRCSTKYGENIAIEFSKKLAKNNITIVSGMAKGIDSNAHLGAIEAGGKTIAVLGSGFNHIFPSKEMFHKILESGGTIITEYEPNVDIFSQGFRDRNRIVAGLSMGIFVVEAKIKSGTGITAGYAKKFNKKIFCIPHAIEDKSGIGTNRLIKNGAILVTSPEEILKQIGNKTIKEEIKANAEINIPDEYKEIYAILQYDNLNADELSKKIKISINQINVLLTMMELEGYIECLPGNYFRAKVI